MARRRGGRRREPSGRRARVGTAEKRDELRSFFSKQPHRRGFPDPLDERLGYPLGRVYAAGDLSRAQFETGEEFTRIVLQYNRILGLPNLGNQHIPGLGLGADPDQDAIDAVRARYDGIITHLGLHSTSLRTLKRVCILQVEDGWHLRDLQRALDKLSRHLGVRRPMTRRTHPFLSLAV